MFCARGSDGHDPARRVRVRKIRRDGDERLEVWMSRDDERALFVKHDVIRRERRRHARGERERLRGDVASIKEDFAERRRGDRDSFAVGRDRDAIREGDVRRHHDRRRGRRGRFVVEREIDVGRPGEREGEDRFGDGEGLAEEAREAPREPVVVREVERGRARERQRVGRDEVRRAGDGANPRCAVGRLPREGELLDRAVVTCVVDDEQVGGGAVVVRPSLGT